MFEQMKNWLGRFPLNRKLNTIRNDLAHTREDLEETKLLLGRMFSWQLAERGRLKNINEAEFKIFSQWNDDGIIQYLVQQLQPEQRTFIEFGVEDYSEANTRFLLMNDNWSGLVMDGSAENIKQIKERPWFWKYDLKAVSAFIDAGNINELIRTQGISGRIGILSIDIDGNDYWVLEALTAVEADILIVEYNPLFGTKRAITVPYKKDFVRERAHYSHLYFGASLAALTRLAAKKGYALAGCESHGANAYFVRKEFSKTIQPLTVETAYRPALYRQSRDNSGHLDYLNTPEATSAIRGLPVINVETGKTETL